MAYQKPCVAIHSVLGHYAKISGEHLPYSFYRSNKTTALAYSMPIDRPLVSVKLHGKNGSKDLYMVRERVQVQIVLTFFFKFNFRVQTIQSTYPNLYFPLNLWKDDQPIASVFGEERELQLPKFEVWKLDQDKIGSASVTTPPPYRNDLPGCIKSLMCDENVDKQTSESITHSDMAKPKVYPVPKGRMGVKFNPLFDQDINCKNVTYEVVTARDSNGLKRKRAGAVSTPAGEGSEEKTKKTK